MAKIYISSTFEDLKSHREAVYRSLRRLNQDVTAMEQYVARDQRPVKKCLKDVGSCDMYVGLLAWRYGYVPPAKNPKKQSVTEMEFRHAGARNVERLMFLAQDDHPWPPRYIDAVAGKVDEAQKLAALRSEIEQELLCDFFASPDNLAALVTAAVSMGLARTTVTEFTLPEELTDISVIRKFGSTLTPEIVEKIKRAMDATAGSRVIEVDLGSGKTWWSTRLFLLAGLAETYTRIESLMFVDGRGNFLGMASPAAVRKAFGRDDPRLEVALRQSLENGVRDSLPADDAVVRAAQTFRSHWQNEESGVKRWVTGALLRKLLGDELVTAKVKMDDQQQDDTLSLMGRVLNQASPLVPVVRRGKTIRIMDRVELATSVATSRIGGMF